MFCLLLYVAIQHKKREKVVEFFEIHGAELQGNPEWVRWFGMCFTLSFLCSTPRRDATRQEQRTR